MDSLIVNLPSFTESLTHQTKQASISEDEFRFGLEPDTCSREDRIVQIGFFILFGGVLKLMLLLISTFLYILCMLPIVAFAHTNFGHQLMEIYGYLVSRVYIRLVLLSFGIVKVAINGDPDPKTRVFTFNHQTYLDGPLLFAYKPFRVIVMKEMLEVPIFGRILMAAKSIFVDRSRPGGQSELINEAIHESQSLPIALSPEGKTTRGKYLLAFRTGAFLTDEIIQPVTLRFHMHGAIAKTTLDCLVGDFKEHLWRCLCVPFTTVSIDFLDIFNSPKFRAMTPQEKADQCQLEMANHLGVLAIDRSSRSLFGVH